MKELSKKELSNVAPASLKLSRQKNLDFANLFCETQSILFCINLEEVKLSYEHLYAIDGFSLYSGINDYIPEHFKSYFTEKIWLRNYSQ